MITKPFISIMALLLVLAYLGALIVSTAHLSQVYLLFNAGLPSWISFGLAVALEAVAFLFSIISTSLGKRAGPWAAWASTSALLLVWAGNGYAMMLAAPTLEWYVVLAASCFVPICTLFVGKVLGGLFSLLDELGQQEREAAEQAEAEEREAAEQVRTLAAGTVSGQLVQQGEESRLPATATSEATETPVARQTVQVRSVAAPLPVHRPPPVRRPTLADESPVLRPGTATATHSDHVEGTVPCPVPAIPPAPSAETGNSAEPVLNTELEDASPAAAKPDPQRLADEGTVPFPGPAIPPTPSTETGDSSPPVLNTVSEDATPAATMPGTQLLPDEEFPESTIPPIPSTETGDSNPSVLNAEREDAWPATVAPDLQLLAAEGTVATTEPAISPAPSTVTGDSGEPGLNGEIEAALPAASTLDPRLRADGVTEERYGNMSVAWTKKREGQQRGGRRGSLTPEQELTLTLLRRFKRPWQVIVGEFGVNERRARGIAGDVQAELTARRLW